MRNFSFLFSFFGSFGTLFNTPHLTHWWKFTATYNRHWASIRQPAKPLTTYFLLKTSCHGLSHSLNSGHTIIGRTYDVNASPLMTDSKSPPNGRRWKWTYVLCFLELLWKYFVLLCWNFSRRTSIFQAHKRWEQFFFSSWCLVMQPEQFSTSQTQRARLRFILSQLLE